MVLGHKPSFLSVFEWTLPVLLFGFVKDLATILQWSLWVS